MMRKFLVGAVCALGVCAEGASAQTAMDRAGEIKAWREQCNHPDPDLRLAYLEEALKTKDTSIIRICVRLALESDNADIRNLGLRAAIAGFDQLTFDVKMPPNLAEALEEAGDDEDRKEQIGKWYIWRVYSGVRNGLVFAIDKADVANGQSVWYAFGSNSRADKDYPGKAIITGDRIRWTGRVHLDNSRDCTMEVQLNDAGVLEGSIQCDTLWPIPISVALL